MSTILIDRLSELVTSGEISRSGLARAAGLHPNSLRKLGDMDCNPTADTLVKLEKFLASGSRGVMASPEQIIDQARNGSTFILVDDDERENEGDLVTPAQLPTPDRTQQRRVGNARVRTSTSRRQPPNYKKH